MPYNQTSVIPWVNRIYPNLQKMEREALDFIAHCGAQGATCEEFALAQGKYPNAVSGRFTSLKAQDLIITHGQRKTGAGNWADVYVVNEKYVQEIEVPLREIPQGKQAQLAFVI